VAAAQMHECFLNKLIKFQPSRCGQKGLLFSFIVRRFTGHPAGTWARSVQPVFSIYAGFSPHLSPSTMTPFSITGMSKQQKWGRSKTCDRNCDNGQAPLLKHIFWTNKWRRFVFGSLNYSAFLVEIFKTVSFQCMFLFRDNHSYFDLPIFITGSNIASID
jgi:hypothetical protein